MKLHRSLGEASAPALSAEVKEQFADVAWRQPARLRNRVVHGYWSIDLDIVHTTAQEQLPGFAADLKRVLTAVSAEGDQKHVADRFEARRFAGDRPMMGCRARPGVPAAWVPARNVHRRG